MTISRFLKPSPLAMGVLMSLGLSGCSTIPGPDEMATPQESIEKHESQWAATPAITRRQSRNSMEIIRPGTLPESVSQQPISIDLQQKLTLEKLPQVLNQSGVSAALGAIEDASTKITIPSHNGTIGSLLDIISYTSGVHFAWTGSSIIVQDQAQYILRVPQQEDIIGAIEKGLKSLGASDVTASQESGIVRYRATQSDQETIEVYLDRLANNTSVIGLQLAVINVTLDRQQKSGLDWSALEAQAGDIQILGGEDGSASASATDSALRLSGQGLGLAVEGADLTLNAALNLLSSYGQSQTSQNLTLKTLSGIPVSIRSGTTTPYIDDVPVSATGETVSTGVETETLETGFEAEVNPYFDAEEQLVTLSVDLDLSTLLGFRELNGGSNVGTLRQPETQDQKFNSTIRLDAGESAIVGGLVFESISDNRNSLTGMEDIPVGSQSLDTQKNALFILVRPTVTIYQPNELNMPQDEALSQGPQTQRPSNTSNTSVAREPQKRDRQASASRGSIDASSARDGG